MKYTKFKIEAHPIDGSDSWEFKNVSRWTENRGIMTIEYIQPHKKSIINIAAFSTIYIDSDGTFEK